MGKPTDPFNSGQPLTGTGQDDQRWKKIRTIGGIKGKGLKGRLFNPDFF